MFHTTMGRWQFVEKSSKSEHKTLRTMCQTKASKATRLTQRWTGDKAARHLNPTVKRQTRSLWAEAFPGDKSIDTDTGKGAAS